MCRFGEVRLGDCRVVREKFRSSLNPLPVLIFIGCCRLILSPTSNHTLINDQDVPLVRFESEAEDTDQYMPEPVGSSSLAVGK